MQRLQIPDAVFDQHIVLLGKTRAGKSSLMRLMIERLLDQKTPVCIIDPKGDWWGLKSSADGKRAGYPVVIFGGEHGDIPINRNSGAEVAALVATGNRPCIIDLKGWTVADRTNFFIHFAEAFFKKTRGRRILAIDECHNFCPQTGGRVDPQTALMLHWANRLASEGSGMGITLISASQRPQKVHKDYLSSHETLIAKRVIHKRDRMAYVDWIEACGDDQYADQILNTVAGMKRSEAWVWSPEIDFGPVRLNFPMFKTYDSFKPQAAKSRRLKGWASVDLDDVKAKFAKEIEERKTTDPAELRKRITELERQIKAKPAPSNKDAKAETTSYKKGYDLGQQQGYDAGAKVEADRFKKLIAGYHSEFAQVHQKFGNMIQSQRSGLSKIKPIKTKTLIPDRQVERPVDQHQGSAIAKVATPRQSRGTPAPQGSGSGGVSLPIGERSILIAAVQFDGVDRDQLSVLTGYKKSSRNTYLSRLIEKGYVKSEGDKVKPTESGIEALGADYDVLPEGEALRDYWLNGKGKLPIGEAAILKALIAVFPNAMTGAEIDQHAKYKKSSRNTYLSRLNARRLIDCEGNTFKASGMLFD